MPPEKRPQRLAQNARQPLIAHPLPFAGQGAWCIAVGVFPSSTRPAHRRLYERTDTVRAGLEERCIYHQVLASFRGRCVSDVTFPQDPALTVGSKLAA
jgi:hypothetical protein